MTPTKIPYVHSTGSYGNLKILKLKLFIIKQVIALPWFVHLLRGDNP